MRKAETAPKKLLVLSLIPMLAFGAVAYLDQHSEVVMDGVAYVEPAPIVPVKIIPIDQAPDLTPDDAQCRACAMSL